MALHRHLRSLPEPERGQLRASHDGYIQEWAALLRQARPDLAKDESAAFAQLTSWSIASLLTISHLRRRPTFERDLLAVATTILGLDVAGSAD
ncbi:hypothetical protein CRM89_28495 [Nocardia sp. FDAARGOS_372]|nr:hypothetical protein CRM89_28495 [Nocardia sp. FDAARGOS_372]